MDIEHARFNMIEQQIRTWDVLDPDVLEILGAMRREDFVPPVYRDLAFSDLELPLVVDGQSTGQVMLAPKVEARLLQAAAPRRHENVLEIGAGSGFMAALLAQRARRVVSCELIPELAEFAGNNLKRAQIGNASVELRNGLDAAAAETWDIIVLSGSVAYVPETLLRRLNAGGRLVGFVGDLPVMTAQCITRAAEREFQCEELFDGVAPRLQGFPEKESFRF